MATKLPPVDIVIVGMGWTGGIMAKELGPTGLKIVVLERGGQRSAQNDFAVPLIRDELRFSQRHDMMMDVSVDTFTIRNKPSETALPMRRLGSFLPGEGVGGSGVHWNGVTWRWPDHELRIRTKYEERYGRSYVPADMPLQDWGISGPELEPYYDKFEYTAGVSGRAGNIKGQIQKAGNPFEDSRSRDYPLPPLVQNHAGQLFAKTAAELGYHPFVRPTANASQPYTNPDGMKIGQCQYCGFCERFGCEANAKGSPLITVIPVALRNPNVELRNLYLGHQSAQRFDRQEGDRCALHQCADRRGDRAAGRSCDPLGLWFGKRASDCCCRASASPMIPKRKPASSAKTTPIRPEPISRCSSRTRTSIRSWRPAGGAPPSTTSIPTGGSTERRMGSSAGLHHGRRQQRPAHHLSPGSALDAAMGLRLETRHGQVVQQCIGDQRFRFRDAEPVQLSRTRQDLYQPVWLAADAHDIRFQGK